MINFDNVNKANGLYSFLYRYIQFARNMIFYRNFYVIGKEKLPKDEGYLVVCNHQDGLCDALGILFTVGVKHGPVFIARGDIFKKDGLAKLLRFFRIMPAFRVRDAGYEGLGQNDAIFEQSARILNEGDVVALFPEAGHQRGRFLARFRKGFARIAFRAAEENRFSKPLKIVPMAHHYSNYFNAQSQMLMVVGDPFDISDLYELYKTDANKAIAQLNERGHEKIKELMLDISDSGHYDQYELLCTMHRRPWLKAHGMNPLYFPNELTADKAIVAALDEYKTKEPEAFDSLMEQTARYGHLLKQLKLRDWIFTRRFMGGFPWLWLYILLLAPLFLYSFLCNLVPLIVTQAIVNKVKDKMFHASVRLVVTIFILPVWYLILFAVCWICTKTWWIALAFLVTLYPSFILYVRAKIYFLKMYNRTRRFFLKLAHNPLLAQAEALRRDVVARLGKCF